MSFLLSLDKHPPETTLNEQSFISGAVCHLLLPLPSGPTGRQDRTWAGPRGDKREPILRRDASVRPPRVLQRPVAGRGARGRWPPERSTCIHSKDDLLASIFERTMRDAIDQGRAALAGLAEPLDRLRAIARLHLDRLGRDRDLAVVFQGGTPSVDQTHGALLGHCCGNTSASSGARSPMVRPRACSRSDVNPTTAAKIVFRRASTKWPPTGCSAAGGTLVADADRHRSRGGWSGQPDRDTARSSAAKTPCLAGPRRVAGAGLRISSAKGRVMTIRTVAVLGAGTWVLR